MSIKRWEITIDDLQALMNDGATYPFDIDGEAGVVSFYDEQGDEKPIFKIKLREIKNEN